jgi:Flp pilus assembly protein CpaB
MDIAVRLLIAVVFVVVFFVIVWLYRRIEVTPPATPRLAKTGAGGVDDEEVVGVIVAALAVTMATSPSKIRISNIKLVDDGSAWRNYSRQRLFSRSQCWETRK